MYEELLIEAEKENIEVIERDFKSTIKGLYCDNVIATKKGMTYKEKTSVLAEELGHYHRTYGDILDQSDTVNRKEERKARIWAYKRLVGLTKLIDAFNVGVKNRYELSEFLGVPEDFIEEAITYYYQRYGQLIQIDDYTIYFNPLVVSRCL